MRNLTIQERKEIEVIRDMINGNINQMCVSDSVIEVYDRAMYAVIEIISLKDIVADRFTDQT